jgi:hypothetical protein
MRGATVAIGVSLGLGVVAGTGYARAEDRASVVLSYDASRAETNCPDEASFRNLVAARLGYDPFTTQALDRVDIEIVRSASQLRGRASVQRAGTKGGGDREIVGRHDECEALAAALATTVAIALDPVRAMGPTLAPPVLPPPPPVATPTEPSAPPPPVVVRDTRPALPPSVRKESIRLFGSAAGVASVGAAPSITLGGEVGFGLGVRAFSLELTGRAEAMPGAAQVPSGDRIEVTILSTALVPCSHFGGVAVCAFGRVGTFQGYATDVATPSLHTSVFASAGARSGYTLALSSVFALQGEIEVGFPLVRTALAIDGASVWTAPPVIGGVSLGAVVRFL